MVIDDLRRDPYEDWMEGRALFNAGPMDLHHYVDCCWVRGPDPGEERLVFGSLAANPLLDLLWRVVELCEERLVEVHSRDSGVRHGYLVGVERVSFFGTGPNLILCERSDYIGTGSGLHIGGLNIIHLRVLEGPRPRGWWDERGGT